MHKRRDILLTIPIVGFLGFFLVWPLLHVFQAALSEGQTFSLFYFRKLFSGSLQVEAVATSLWIAAWVTVLSLALAMPMAWLMSRYTFRGKALFSGLVLVPMILPPFVGAVGMKMLFARCGAVSTLLMRLGIADQPVDWLGAYPLLGVVILEALHLYPILYLNLVAAFANIDPSLEEAAANVGASPARIFRRVVLPLSGPGIFAGLTLVFIWSFTELGTPLIFGVRRVLPVMIYDNVSEVGTNPMGYAQVVLVLLVSAGGYWLVKKLTRRDHAVATLGRLAVSGRERRLGTGRAALLYLFLGLVVLLSILPHVSVVMVSLSTRWFMTVLPEGFTLEFFGRVVGSDLTRTAMVNSLVLSLCASAIDLAAGFTIAWLCVRRRIAGADLLDALAMLPLAVPGLVIAFGYFGCFSGISTGGLSFLDPRKNPLPLLAISYGIRRLPFMVRAAHAGLEQVSAVYEEAAANLGASPFRVIRRVTFPLVAANLLAGGILCFAFSMLEVSDSLILAQSEAFYPITKAIYVIMEGLEHGINEASALGVWAMALLGAALLWAAALMGKRIGQMFRL